MQDYDIFDTRKRQSIRIIFTIMILFIFLFVIIPWKTAANPVAIYDPIWNIGENILKLFFTNLIIDGLIMLVPLFIISKLGYDKKISELWVFGVPLIALWGGLY